MLVEWTCSCSPRARLQSCRPPELQRCRAAAWRTQYDDITNTRPSQLLCKDQTCMASVLPAATDTQRGEETEGEKTEKREREQREKKREPREIKRKRE